MEARIVFCSRCRCLKVGWNKRYVAHSVFCRGWLSNPSRFAGLAILTSALVLAWQQTGASVPSVDKSELLVPQVSLSADRTAPDPAIHVIDAFLKQHEVSELNRGRLAVSIVASARKFNLDPKLIASITIVESRGNPFAISGKSAVGIMQIHLPTWGKTADREGVNLFKIEDNIDFGARILNDYIRKYGVKEGVRRYAGFIHGNAESEQTADQYEAKVQRTYGIGPAKA